MGVLPSRDPRCEELRQARHVARRWLEPPAPGRYVADDAEEHPLGRLLVREAGRPAPALLPPTDLPARAALPNAAVGPLPRLGRLPAGAWGFGCSTLLSRRARNPLCMSDFV